MDNLVDFVDHVLRPLWVVLVMSVFLGIALWAYWPKNKAKFKSIGESILRDDDPAPLAPTIELPAKPAKER